MSDELVTVPLRLCAHARTGDKGDRLNIGLFAWHEDAFAHLVSQLDEARVLAAFRHKGAAACRRHLLPKLAAMNFVLDRALEGGVNASLNLDGHGKSFSYILVDLEVRVPGHCVRTEAVS